ncbi:TonB-dependent receptor [Aquimarina rhabdastrellae]
MKSYIVILGLFLSAFVGYSQEGILTGKITAKGVSLPYTTVKVENKELSTGATSDENGVYKLEKLPIGIYQLSIYLMGYQSVSEKVEIKENQTINKDYDLQEDRLNLDQVVVSATRNRVNRKKAPVVVSTLSPKLLTATQSISLADGLNYSPGVRVETNCQNCGFTQVRLNGLDGAYTQVLVNSRAIFTSLVGVYGLEQIPTNIIEQVEVVRSGGSALFGSSAIAGTVNVITKDPVLNTWEIGSNFTFIDGKTPDRNLTFNASIVADDLNSGVTLFGTYRNRDSFDANEDGFSEITKLTNNTVGAKAFIKPNDRSKVTVNATAIKEFRRGGDRLDLSPQFTDITEQLDHDTFLGGAEYEIQSKDLSNAFAVYTSASYTKRLSYYGGLGGGRTAQDSILANNSFGNTKDLAWVNGAQYTKNFKNEDVLTTGIEYNHSDTKDEILGYNRLIDQSVNTIGAYAQYEWKPTDKFTTLIGARFDNVDVSGAYQVGDISRNVSINQSAFSPRLTIAYKFTDELKFRGGYARGFRAPQAFNEDLHISSVGGEPQFVILSEQLETEYSNAYTASLNYSKNFKKVQTDFLLESFYTTLEDPFTIISTGSPLSNGSILEEVRNGSGAKVYGANIEIGISPSKKWQFQLGGTIQESKYDEPQLLFETDGTVAGETNIAVDEFVRNPNVYGYFNASWIPGEIFNVDVTGTYTGGMTVPRVVSDTGFLQLNNVDSFFDLNIKLESHVDFTENFQVTFSGGVKNLFNSYQDDFDIGAGRDSDYIYGPNAPRSFFIGIKLGKMH